MDICSITHGLEMLYWGAERGEKLMADVCSALGFRLVALLFLLLQGCITACGSTRVSPEGMVSAGLRKQL